MSTSEVTVPVTVLGCRSILPVCANSISCLKYSGRKLNMVFRKNYLNKTLTQILKNLDHVTPSTVQMNVNGSQPIKINVNETMREKRDLW